MSNTIAISLRPAFDAESALDAEPGPAADPAPGRDPATIDLSRRAPTPSRCCAERPADRGPSVTIRVNELPDVELLAMFDGGRAAPLFEAELFRRIRRYAAPELRSIVGATPDEDDLSQEVCTKVWVSLGRFDADQASFRTWVSRIAGNTGRDYLRRVSARPKPAPVIDDPGCTSRLGWDVRVSGRSSDRPTEEAHVLAIVVDTYCQSRKSMAEAQAVRAVLAEGYRIADVKAMHPSVAGRVDAWVKKARNTLRAEVSTDAG